MRPEMLRQIHKSHLGIAKCRQRAREVLFWPGMSLDVEQMVTNCSVCVCVCADFANKQPTGPLKPTVPPSLPWQKIATDLFEFQRGTLFTLCVLSQQVPRSYQDGVLEKQCCSTRVEEAIWSPWDSSRSGLR